MCPDPTTFYLDTIERAVLSGLKVELLQPQILAEWLRTYHAERKRLARKQDAWRGNSQRRIGEVTREIDRLADAIAKGHGDPAVLGLALQLSHKNASSLRTSCRNPHPQLLLYIRARSNGMSGKLPISTLQSPPASKLAIRKRRRPFRELVEVYRDLSRPGQSK
jgi:hypothetical protein